MRRLILVALALLVALPASAGAADTGVLKGRVLHAITNEPIEGVEVRLTSALFDGSERETATVITDERGHYLFEDLATGDDRLYVLDAFHDGGRFATPALPPIPDDTTKTPILTSTLRVWDTTTDPGSIAIRRDDLFVVPKDGGASVIESVTVVNTSDQAYIGRAGEATSATLGFALPPGVEQSGFAIVDSTIDQPDVVGTSFGFATTVAIPPGETRTTFTYRVPAATGVFDLSRTALYPLLEFSVYVAEPLSIESSRLTGPDPETVTLEGETYKQWSTTDTLDAGDSIQIQALAKTEGWLGLPVLVTIVAGIACLAGLAALLVRRRRARLVRPSVPDHPRDPIAAIAVLDIAYENGELSKEDWARRRTELKDAARRSRSPERVP